MSTRNILFVDFILLLCLLLYFCVGIFSFRRVDCSSNTTIYNANSASGRIYRSNLDILFSTLASNASPPNGFYNFSVGSLDPANYTAVHGLFLCRGDLTTSVCQQCVATARTEISGLCPDRKISVIWYDECMLRYSNQSIFSILNTSVISYAVNRNNVRDQALLKQALGDTMDQIAINAANDNSGKKFAVKEAKFTTFQRRIYALGQCTPDLSSMDCGTCPSAVQIGRELELLYPAVILGTRLIQFTPPPPPPPAAAAAANSKGMPKSFL